MKGRPDFIPKEVFRSYLSMREMDRFISVDWMLASSFIKNEKRLNKPIRCYKHKYRNGRNSYRNTFRIIDVVARARAKGLSIVSAQEYIDSRKNKSLEMRKKLDHLEASIKSLDRDCNRKNIKLHKLIRVQELDKSAFLSKSQIIESSEPVDLFSGVYFLIHKNDIVYIGQSVNVAARVSAHIEDGEKIFTRVCYIPCEKEKLNLLESIYITMFYPKYNNHTPIHHERLNDMIFSSNSHVS